MTTEHQPPRDAARPQQSDLPRETEVERARAELVSALQEFEDKINFPKRIRRMWDEEPAKVYSAIGVVGAAIGGAVTLIVALRRRH
ncbi:hypothetical protein ACFOYW_12000 [Gryllotalpicola reticulitermitis]|uniref:DUF3618 domain-containing protein n=1 Tax=Gryllotalpicola reticulitermitis TaxID=1184153 RepID=A0ABV8Q7W0_9MICO